MAIDNGAIRVRNRTARWLTEVFQPPVVVSLQLLISPLAQPGFPGTVGYGALAALFVCVLPLMVLLVLVRLGKVTDHHVSDRKQRAPVLLMALGCIAVGLLVLGAVDAPESVFAMVLAVVGGVAVLAVVSPFWKMSGHAAAVSCAAVVPAGLFCVYKAMSIWRPGMPVYLVMPKLPTPLAWRPSRPCAARVPIMLPNMLPAMPLISGISSIPIRL